MKRLFFSILFSTVCFLPSVFSAEWFAAPNGSDDNTGTKDKPFATFEKAQAAVRADKDANKKVNFAAGEYLLTKPLVFTAEDSGTDANPIVYSGVESKTIFSGGVEIKGWKDDSKNGESIWSADLPVVNGQKAYFEQLFIGSRRATRARHPNTGFFMPKEVYQELPINERNQKRSYTEQAVIANDGELDLLKGLSAEELRFGQFIVHHHWDTTKRILLEYDADKNRLKMQGGAMKAWNPWRSPQFDKDGKQTKPGSLYYIENVKTSFDQAGEWFYDGVNGKVLYRPLPGEKLEDVTNGKTVFRYPRSGLNQLILIRGNTANSQTVHDIKFEGISLEFTDSPRRLNVMKGANLAPKVTGDLNLPGPSQIEPQQAAFWADAVVDVQGASNIVFSKCEIKNIGEYGLWLKDSTKCKIERCAFTDLGAGAVRIGGVGNTNNNVVDNCIIQRGGRLYSCAVAVWLGNATEDNQITHNDIGDFYYTGISAGWTWGYKGGVAFRNNIEYNRIHKLGQGAMADMGGVYTLGTSHGTRVCNNVIFDVKSYGYGGWGLYTDEGSEGILMENNLVYDTTDGSFHQHYGKNNVVRNNILAFSTPHQVAVTRVEPHRSLTFDNNIVVYNEGKAIGYRADKARIDYGSNLWWNYSKKDEVDFAGKTHKDWLDFGKDVAGVIADPLFVDAAKRDFRFKDDSEIKKIEFVPFDYSKAGVYGDNNWIKRALEE
ncbi:MAG: right-handed parallel beta-helix repeat-containing protein [Planctomycetaceae bacterium]|jgi:hypothetical protein|nr:right-handed parallel beta-helix repeat-containing protein [Planctomycetaceae bacterium]